MDQSESRILYHVTSLTASPFFGGLGPSFWGLVPLGQHGIEASGSDVMASGSDVLASGSDAIKPEINDRPRGLVKKTHFIQRSGLGSRLSGEVGGMSVV